MQSGLKKTFSVLLIIIALGLVFGFGNYLGRSAGEKKAELALAPLLNYAFPEPPAEIRSLSGKIIGITGATINLEIADPDDYLPHADLSPRRTETRSVVVTKDTVIRLLNYGRIDSEGRPQTTTLKFNDLKIGDAVTVQSKQNIKNAPKFDASEIFLLKY